MYNRISSLLNTATWINVLRCCTNFQLWPFAKEICNCQSKTLPWLLSSESRKIANSNSSIFLVSINLNNTAHESLVCNTCWLMLARVTEGGGGGGGGWGSEGGLQVCIVVSEFFSKNPFSNLSISITIFETVKLLEQRQLSRTKFKKVIYIINWRKSIREKVTGY